MDRTNESQSGYTFNGQQYQKQNRTDSQGNTYTVDVASSAIPASTLNSQTQAFSTPTPAPATDYNQMTAGVTNPYVEKQAQSNLEMQSSPTGDALAIQNLMNQASGKNAYEGQQAQSLGLNSANEAYITKQAELTSLAKQAAAAQQENIAQGRQLGSVGSFVAGQGNEIERNRAIRALTIGAELDAIKGNIDVARMKVQQAVDAKYGDIERDLANREKFFEINSKERERLSREEQKQYDRAKDARAEKAKETQERKAQEKDISDLLINASSQGVPPSIEAKAKAIQARGGSAQEVASALGLYSGDYLSTQIKKAQLQKLNLDNKDAYNKLYSTPVGGLKQLSYEENAKFNSTPEVKGLKDASGYAQAVADYKSAINKYGTGEMFGSGKGVLGQAYSALVGATKDYYTLGTLDSGVQKLIALGIPEPGVLGIKSSRVGALDEALRSANAKIKTNTDQLLKTNYKNTEELKQLLDGANNSLLSQIGNEELLNSIPGSTQGANTTSTANFFNK